MNPESKYTVKKTFSAETVVFPVIFLAFFAYLAHVMGMANMINTIMKTAFDLLINTVLYIVAVCVIMGAVSELLTEFGFVALMDRGLLAAGDVAVFTAMCMCWSGYLSTHTSMMDSLHCKELTGKALISHTIGGIAAGFAAHWIFILVNLL